MKRLGKFGGKIYDENIDTSTLKECCNLITKEQEASDSFISDLKKRNKGVCAICQGCPMAKGL